MEVLRSGGALPPPGDVEVLYALASETDEAPEAAEVFAALYDLALDRTDLVVVTAKEVGELVGFGYGHRWRWAEQTDDWSADLARGLGPEAVGRLEDSFAVQLLAVHPRFTRHGLGFELLKQLMVASAANVYWLQAPDADSAAKRLFGRMGYRRLGDGLPGPDGAPGSVLVHG